MINSLFNKVKNLPGCVSFAPATDEQIATTNSFLVSHSLAPLTVEYQEFLKMSNGFSFGGVEFYGTIPQQRADKAYIFPDIISSTQPYCKYEYFIGKVIIGRLSESIMLYNSKENIYAVIDRVNLRSRIELPSFEEVFGFMMKTCFIDNK